MDIVQYITLFLLSTLLISTDTLNARKWRENYDSNFEVARTITVDQSGGGDFTKVQDAINSVPSNNNEWIKIHLKAGIYTEKVNITADRQFIALEGEGQTVIQYGDSGPTNSSSTFSLYASNFVAYNIVFKNTYNKMLITPSNYNQRITWAPAILIQGDKSSFYKCKFIGLQDTLSDMLGRHYFKHCYIRGAIDFIWGHGQSIYENCLINVASALLPPGSPSYITAQGRETEDSTSGFVFKRCAITGTGSTKPTTYLGRAWREYSRVIYHNCSMSNIIAPEGWREWNGKGSSGRIQFAEAANKGLGADMSKRVKWLAKLTPEVLLSFLKLRYINENNWLEMQPLGLYDHADSDA